MEKTGKIFVILLLALVQHELVSSEDACNYVPESHDYHQRCKSSSDEFKVIVDGYSMKCPCVPHVSRHMCEGGRSMSVEYADSAEMREIYKQQCIDEPRASNFAFNPYGKRACKCSPTRAVFDCQQGNVTLVFPLYCEVRETYLVN